MEQKAIITATGQDQSAQEQINAMRVHLQQYQDQYARNLQFQVERERNMQHGHTDKQPYDALLK